MATREQGWLCTLLCVVGSLLLSLAVFDSSVSAAHQRREGSEPLVWAVRGHDRHTSSRVRRKAVLHDSSLWPNATVPYVFSSGVDHSTRGVVLSAMKHVEQYTCIRFDGSRTRDELERRNSAVKYVDFIMSTGCSSSVGMGHGTGAQHLTMNRYCALRPMIIHELGHVVGMWHEHSRADRNSHVMVMWNNIMEGEEFRVNFVREDSMRLITPYDFSSIMHYKLNMFVDKTKPLGSLTLRPLPGERAENAGKATSLSFYDMYTLNTLYGCADHCDSTNSPVCQNGGFLNKRCQCVCPPGIKGRVCELLACPVLESCGGILDVLQSEVISVPETRGRKSAPSCCMWLFKSPPGTQMKLEMTDLDSSSTCEERPVVQPYSLGIDTEITFCGEATAIRNITSTSNTMMLKILSQGDQPVRPFRAVISVEAVVDCASDPCQNGGTCVSTPAADTYYCECTPNYFGKNCQVATESTGWSAWSRWSSCRAVCGRQYRTRECVSPEGSEGAVECEGQGRESRQCTSPYYNCNETYRCEFGEGDGVNSCGMQQDATDQMDWMLHRGLTSTPLTGPSTGHTSASPNDGYMYLEASDGDMGDTATIWFPETNWTIGIYCLQFYYHMYGNNVGSLSLLREYSSQVPAKTIWRKSGDSGAEWMEASFNVLLYNNVKLALQAERGRSYMGDIAVDDISLSPTRCRQFSTPVLRSGEMPYGCYMGHQFFREGPFSFFENSCIRVNCFCNLDRQVDCPESKKEDKCKRFGRIQNRRLNNRFMPNYRLPLV